MFNPRKEEYSIRDVNDYETFKIINEAHNVLPWPRLTEIFIETGKKYPEVRMGIHFGDMADNIIGHIEEYKSSMEERKKTVKKISENEYKEMCLGIDKIFSDKLHRDHDDSLIVKNGTDKEALLHKFNDSLSESFENEKKDDKFLTRSSLNGYDVRIVLYEDEFKKILQKQYDIEKIFSNNLDNIHVEETEKSLIIYTEPQISLLYKSKNLSDRKKKTVCLEFEPKFELDPCMSDILENRRGVLVYESEVDPELKESLNKYGDLLKNRLKMLEDQIEIYKEYDKKIRKLSLGNDIDEAANRYLKCAKRLLK